MQPRERSACSGPAILPPGRPTNQADRLRWLLPRLFGHPLHSRRLAIAHLFVANAGLGGLVLGFLLQPGVEAVARWATAGGGLLFAVGAMLWVFNLWRTFDAADARQRARQQTDQRQLPTMNDQS